jgi:hypothetical protein
MTDFVEVYNQATGRREVIPEDWLDNPVLNHDVNGDLLQRVTPAEVAEQEQAGLERPTANSKHDEIDAYARALLGEDFTWPEGTATRQDKIDVLDNLVPDADAGSAPPVPESEPGVDLVGPVMTESTIPALNQADDKEN